MFVVGGVFFWRGGGGVGVKLNCLSFLKKLT